MATVMVFQKWCHYLLGFHFKVRTDQRNLRFLMDQRVIRGDQQKWVMKVLKFDFEIQYKHRCENKTANTLSRNPSFETELLVMTVAHGEGLEGVEQEVANDEKLQCLVHDMLDNSKSHEGYQLKNG